MSTIQELLLSAPTKVSNSETTLEAIQDEIDNLQDSKQNLTRDVLTVSKVRMEQWVDNKVQYFISQEPYPENVQYQIVHFGDYWEGTNFISSVRCSSTSDISSLSGLPTIDDITCINNDRVLLTGQTNQTENGIWVVHTTAWTRPIDFITGSHAEEVFTFVREGTSRIFTYWVCNSISPSDIIDTDNLTFSNVNTSEDANINEWKIQRREKDPTPTPTPPPVPTPTPPPWGPWVDYFDFADAVSEGETVVIESNENFNYGWDYIKQDPTNLNGSYGIDANISMRLKGKTIITSDKQQQENTITVLSRIIT
jgi:hypothetical protein